MRKRGDNMVAEYTIKINDRYYKAGEIIPDIEETNKAASIREIEPPVSSVEDVVEEVAEQPKQKRQYTRRK